MGGIMHLEHKIKLLQLPFSSVLLFILSTSLLSGCGSSQQATSLKDSETPEIVEPVYIGLPFIYNFFGSDILPWINGTRRGPVPAGVSKQAQFLGDLIKRSGTEISAAIYGLQGQPWLLDAIVNGTPAASFVVDQEKGELNDWVPMNFTYEDTPKLVEVFGYENVTPDLGTSGQPRSSTIMHNKFIVLNQTGLWTGSANFSDNCIGSEYNANTSIYLPFPEVADLFAAEFAQMFVQHRFSVHKEALGKPTVFLFNDDTKLEVFFSPQNDPVTTAVLPFIDSAEQTLEIGMFVLSDERVKEHLINAAARGVKIRIILDALYASGARSYHEELRSHGIDVRIENWGGKMHLKTGIADSWKVLMGSMNWTSAGSRQNDENTIVVGNGLLAREAQQYFEVLWKTLINAEEQTPNAESSKSKNSCFDGIDNDHDGLQDAKEPACKK